MKLTYWIAECLDDSHAYNVRSKRRKDVKARLTADGFVWTETNWRGHQDNYYLARGDGWSRKYGPITKVTVEYDSAFDLVCQALQEGGIKI